MRNQRIGVLMGGLSSERTVSLASGHAVLEALAARDREVVPIFVDRDVDRVLRQAEIDVAFVALHGRYGEDGCVQGLLELLGIPYTGSGVLASALAMHKGRAKELFRLHNLPTPPSYAIAVADELDPDELLARHGDFGYPVVVKPAGEGSSVGVAIVAIARDADQLVAACEAAARFDRELLIERFAPGREVSVAVLEGRALGAVEVAPPRGLYDYGAKLAGSTPCHLPPRLSPERHRGVLLQAERAHRALGCAGATRVDLRVADASNEVVLEVNTLPALAPGALLPRIAAHAGLGFVDLCEALLAGARLHAAGRGGERRIAHRDFAGDERRADAREPH
jgi:D-alanine-D-alanine ligase